MLDSHFHFNEFTRGIHTLEKLEMHHFRLSAHYTKEKPSIFLQYVMFIGPAGIWDPLTILTAAYLHDCIIYIYTLACKYM